MPITSPRTKKQLDDKECFDLWMETGTLEKASKRLTDAGKINQDTGKPFHPISLRFAALRHLIRNPKEVKEKFEEIDPNSPYLISQETWQKFLAKRACEIFRYREEICFDWAKEYDIPKKYVEKYLQ